jgi:hypothetical protein
MKTMSKRKSKVVLGTLLIFALGFFAGAFGANLYFKYRMERIFSQDDPPPVVHLFMKRLDGKLHLTNEQKEEIEAIVRQSHEELRTVRSKFRPEIQIIMRRTFAEIEQQLDEKQKEKFQEFRKRFRFMSPGKERSELPAAQPFDRLVRQFLAEVERELALTDNQRKRVREIVNNHVAEMQTVIQNARHSGQIGTGAARQSLADLNRRTEHKLREILTEEQMSLYIRIWNEQRQNLWAEVRNRRAERMAEGQQ